MFGVCLPLRVMRLALADLGRRFCGDLVVLFGCFGCFCSVFPVSGFSGCPISCVLLVAGVVGWVILRLCLPGGRVWFSAGFCSGMGAGGCVSVQRRHVVGLPGDVLRYRLAAYAWEDTCGIFICLSLLLCSGDNIGLFISASSS
jgi:hypothetical protein